VQATNECYYFVLRALDGPNALVIKSETPAGDGLAAYLRMMKILADDSSASTMSLTMQLMQLKGEEGDDPTKILREQQQLYNKLKAANFTLDDLMRALTLHALPPEFQHLRSKYLDAEDHLGQVLTYGALRTKLETQFTAEAVSDQKPAMASAHALKMVDQANALQKAVDDLAELQKQVQTYQKGGGDVKCTWCKDQGFNCHHNPKQCWRQHPHMRPKDHRRGGKPKETAGAITDSAWCVEGDVPQIRDLHAAGETLAAFERVSDHISGIVLDSGCSGTAVRSQDQLYDVRPARRNHYVKVADGAQYKVKFYGTLRMHMQTDTGDKIMHDVPNVMVVPELGLDLLSVKHILKTGCSVTFSLASSTVSFPGGSRVNIAMTGSLPIIPINKAVLTDSMYSLACSQFQYHGRTMHMSQHTRSDKAVDGVVISGDKQQFICQGCIAGKHHSVPHPRVQHEQSKAFGDLFHSDLIGPLPPSLHNGSQYAIFFVDDFTSFTFVYFLKQKSDALAALKRVIADVHRWGTITVSSH
jgi:hypothetical protein